MASTNIEAIRAILGEVASSIDWSGLSPDDSLSDHGLDSLDKASFVMKLEAETGVGIPDEDYEALDTAAGFIGYVAKHD